MNQYELELFEAQSGRLSAKLLREDGLTLHLHSLVKPEDEWMYFEETDIWGDRLIFAGTGIGYHLSGIREKIPSDSRVLLIDFYEQLVQICKKEFFPETDTVEISSETVDPLRKIREFLQGGRYVQIVKHPASFSAHRDYYSALLDSVLSGSSVSGSGNILVLYGKFFLQEELCRAFAQNGIKAVPFEYEKADSVLKYESRLQYLIQKEKPELIVSVNMLGFDGNGILGDFSSRSGIPVAVWFVDDPDPILLHQQQFVNKNMAAFCWERACLPVLKDAGFSSAMFLPLATDPEMFPFSQECGCSYKTGFVGSSMSRKFLSEIAVKFMWREELEPFVETCARRLLRSPGNVKEIISSVCSETGYALPFSDKRNLVWLHSYIIHNASMIRRKTIIESLIPDGIQTFGDPDGWRGLCGEGLKTNPDIDYRTGLVSVYRNIGVNVNITSCQMPSAVNQRVFDIPACGGFVINDMQQDIKELFDDKEVVTYSSVEQLKELIARYGENEKERFEISRLARERIVQEHTYKRRVKTIMDVIRQGKK